MVPDLIGLDGKGMYFVFIQRGPWDGEMVYIVKFFCFVVSPVMFCVYIYAYVCVCVFVYMCMYTCFCVFHAFSTFPIFFCFIYLFCLFCFLKREVAGLDG